MLLDGYTETTLELHWKATGWSTLKLHWNYTEMPLDGYTETTLHLQRTTNAPPAHHKCTSSAPPTHLNCTPTAPPAHPNCTSSTPQTVHLQRTSNSAPPSTPTSFTCLHPHLQRTSTAPPSTTTFTNPCLAIISEVHLSAPQKCTPPRVRCAPPSTSAHRGMPGLNPDPPYLLMLQLIHASGAEHFSICWNFSKTCHGGWGSWVNITNDISVG